MTQDVEIAGVAAGGRAPVRETLTRLAGAQKAAAPGAPAYSRFVNRRLGRLLAALAHWARLTPNQVTMISAGWTGAAIVLLAVGTPSTPVGILVAAGLLIGYAFDSADGQLARLRGGGSPAGEWLDHVVDAAKISTLHLAVLISWYRIGDRGAVLLLPLAFTTAAAVFFFAQVLTDLLRRTNAAIPQPVATAGWRGLARSVATVPVDYGLVCLSFVLIGWHTVFCAAYGVLLLGLIGYLCLALPTWFVQLASAGVSAEQEDRR